RQFWWLPLGLGCLLRARETGAWSWFVRLGLVGGFATVACFYYGAFLGLASVTVLAVDLVVQRAVPSLRVLRGHGLALAIAAAIAAPAASAFASSYGPSATVATTPTTTAAVTVSDASGAAATTPTTTAAVTVSDASGAAAALEDLYLPRAWARSELDDDARAYTGGRYLGFLAVALALAGVVAHPRRAAPWAGVAVVGVVLSLGSGSDGQPMPFRWLDAAFAFVTEPVNFPARFLAMTMIALPVLGALATRWRWAALLAPLAVIEIQTADLVPWPRETMALPPAGGLAGRGPVFDLGLALDDSRASRLMNVAVQMSLGSPTQAFPVDRLDRWNASGVRWARALPLVQDLRVRRARDVGPHEAYRPDVALLRDRGFERILLTHPTDGLDPQYEGIITALCGAPQRIELATLWTLPAADDGVDATMLAAWRAEQEARVDALVDEDEPGTYPTSPQQR
ncbi:MAG: hypothetical protein FJ090_20810, partial [Deltaproteobacteria bacterium]|nr:hypothetical protein [Deltaproteobacteria bacterium]